MKRILILVLIGILALVIFAPRMAGAWFLNIANADIARALAVNDTVHYDALLNHAQMQIDAAKSFGDDERITLAQTRIYLARGEYERAAKVYDTAPASLRSDSIAQFIWGQAAYQSQLDDLAFARWREGGAFVYFSQNAHRAIDKHDWVQAARLARIGVGIDPTNAEMHYVLAYSLSNLDVFDVNALNEIDLAIATTSDQESLSTYLSLKGEILNSQGNWQIAMNVFETARGVAPIDARPRTDLALLWLRRQPSLQHDAVALLTQVVTDSPWYTAAYIALADVSEKQGDLKQAEAWLRRGLDRNPNNADMLFALGKFYARQKQMDEARALLTQAQNIETRIDIVPMIEKSLAELSVK
jgi:tetratricopeptide (TPR) repeat protein